MLKRVSAMFVIKDKRLKTNYEDKTTNIINIFQEALSSNTYYTDHGQGHSARVIEHLGVLINNFEEVFKLPKLTEAEKYLLHMASHLHDLGMAIEKYEKDEEARRSKHSALSAKFVEENKDLLGLVGDLQGLKMPLKDIIRNHRKQYDIKKEIKDPNPEIGNFGTIRLDLLAAIFRIGDALDVDYRRARELKSKYVINLPEEHKIHWEACQIIDGVKINGASINLTINKDRKDLTNREHLLLLLKMLDLYAELVSVQNIFKEYKIYLFDIVAKFHDGKEVQIFDIISKFFLDLDKGVRVLFVGLFDSLTEKYLFSWDNVPGTDSERLLKYLMTAHDLGGAKAAEIYKSDDDKTITIITDENSAEILIDGDKEKATLKISDGRVHDLKVKNEDDKLNIYTEKIKVEKFEVEQPFEPYKPIESLIKCGLGFRESVNVTSELHLELTMKEAEKIPANVISNIISRILISKNNPEVFRRYKQIYSDREKYIITKKGIIEEFKDSKVRDIMLDLILEEYENRGFKNFRKNDVKKRWDRLIKKGYNEVVRDLLNMLGTDYVHEELIVWLIKELLFEPPRPWFSSAQLPNNWKLLVRWAEEHYSNAEKAIENKEFEKAIEELIECLFDICCAILNSFNLPVGCGTLASFERFKNVIKEIEHKEVKEGECPEFDFYKFLKDNEVNLSSFSTLLKTIDKKFSAIRSKVKYSPEKNDFIKLIGDIQNLRNCIERLVLIKEKEKVEKLFRETTKSSKDDKLLDLAEYLFREIPHSQVFKAEKSKTVNVTYDPLNHVNTDLDEMDIKSTSGGLTILCTFKSKRGKGEYNLDLNALKRYVRNIEDTPYFTDFIKKELKL